MPVDEDVSVNEVVSVGEDVSVGEAAPVNEAVKPRFRRLTDRRVPPVLRPEKGIFK